MEKLALPSYTVPVAAAIIVLVCGRKRARSEEMADRQGHHLQASSLSPLS